MNTFSKVLTGTLLALSIGNAFAGNGVEHNTQAFLDVLNAGTGKPIEQLSPKDARAVLVGAPRPHGRWCIVRVTRHG